MAILTLCTCDSQELGAVPLADLPVWTLQDDNTGLDAFLNEQVCCCWTYSTEFFCSESVCTCLCSCVHIYDVSCLTTSRVQGAVQRLTDLQSALTTVQALIVILSLLQWAAIASAIPRFSLLSSAHRLGHGSVPVSPTDAQLPVNMSVKCMCVAGATIQANGSMGDSMLVAGVVGIPIFFLLLITIGPGDESFSNVRNILDQVASYQFIGESISSGVAQAKLC